MSKILFNENNQLRNPWWIVIFVALVAVSRLFFGPVNNLLKQTEINEVWLEPLPFLFILGITWICCRLRKEPLSKVGLATTPQWFRYLHAGILFSFIQISVIIGVIWLFNGVQFDFNPEFSLQLLLMGLYVFFFAAMMEELLFRGFIFQRLLDGIGIWPTQIGMAALFALAHWSNPEMEGDTLIFASLDIALGALLWGLAFIRTKSLALPIGMHFGWNLTLGSLYGMPVSGYEHAGFLTPIMQEAPLWLHGGNFGPEASIVAVVVDLIALFVLWQWKGINPKQDTKIAAAHA